MIEKGTIYPTVDPSVLAIKGDLYPKLWDNKTKKLNSDISLKLKQIAEDFVRGFEYPIKIRDIILTGSIANYNWNQYSDIDLHILVDFNDIPDQYLDAFKDYFDAKKQLWNKKHLINIMGHEVEIYIQDIDEPHHSTGVFSVMNDKWVKEPVHKDAEIDYEAVSQKTEDFISKIDKVSKLFSGNENEKTIAAVEALQNRLKRYRKAGLEKGGEFSTENLVFKMLRNGGHLENLSNLKQQAYDREMSIEEEIIKFQQTLEEAKKKGDRCVRIAKSKYDVWPSAYASGAVVKCRQGKIWKDIKEEDSSVSEEIELEETFLEELAREESLEEKKSDFSKEKEQGLHGWFARRGGKGKSKGWVDCNTCRKDPKTGKKTCKTCGRGEGEKRSKYPACRPTPSQCTRSGMKRKKSSKQVSWKPKKEE